MREVVPLVQLIVVELEERREGGKGREGRDKEIRRKGRFATSYFSKHTQVNLTTGNIGSTIQKHKNLARERMRLWVCGICV